MTKTRAQSLKEDFQFTTMLIQHYVQGITDEESVLQLPFEANCLNWVVGHILSRRNSVLEALGQDPVWGEGIQARYHTGSQPIRSVADARPFSLLLEDLMATQQRINAALEGATDVDLDRVVENDRGRKPAREHLEGFHWHETYHLGQLDFLQAYIVSLRGS